MKLKSNNETKIFNLRYKPVKNTVNLSINGQQNKIKILSDEKLFNLYEFGISYMPEEVGTGYHIPEGVLLMQGNKSKFIFKDLKQLDTKKIYQKIKKIRGVSNDTETYV